MKRVLLTLSLVGCAGQQLPAPSDAVRMARRQLHLISVLATELANEWAAQVDDRVAFCRAKQLPSVEQRTDCLGPYGEGKQFDDDMLRLIEAYDTAAEAGEELQQALAQVEQRIAAAKQGALP